MNTKNNHHQELESGLDIALVGMAGRFPGGKNLDQFWQNLQRGVESISFFSTEELQSSNLDPILLDDPNYVRAAPLLDDIEKFDASFFGFNPREAEVIDPQHRLFLECAWEALENAGYDSEAYPGLIGVYAGAGMNLYLLQNLRSSPDFIKSEAASQVIPGTHPGFLATSLSYKLNLKGPSVSVQTFCSTSLVTVHLACQSLLNEECDMALAGGVSLSVLQKSGYLYQPGGILSPDGHCRTFDAEAQGTIFGNGIGVVVLKRLEDALTEGDFIHAVIKGSAINNDGSLKASFMAPNVEGQTEVIEETIENAGVDAETITYVETHGTGTNAGDPIEIAALTKAFRTFTDKRGYCAIGSVKSNIGHLDAAAGIAGLIKTTLALKHKLIPPSLHFQQPNPQIDFANSPFYVNTQLLEWQTNGMPRRAGVSSFGIGGTNTHVVLEEAPPPQPSGEARPWQLLILSAKTSSALNTATANLNQHLHAALNLADVAYTLQVGRKAFNHRRIVVCQDIKQAKTALSSLNPNSVWSAYQEHRDRPVAFMFSGQGTQYVHMAQALYLHEPTFRHCIDRCCDLLQPHLGFDLRSVLYPSSDQQQAATEQLQQTAVTQPALFVVEYALAQLWQEWGIQPATMIGHSLGEYVAATLAGVWSLEDGLGLVAARAALMQALPGGSMLAVPLSEQQVQPWLGEDLSLAAVNAPSACVISGATTAIKTVEQQLETQGVVSRRLHTSHAFHSQMMEPMLAAFSERVKRLKLHPPQIPYLSNLTGKWVTAEEATDPHYWVKHLRQPVRFESGLRTLLQSRQVLLEVGPGQTLIRLAQRHPNKQAGQVVLSSLPHAQDPGSALQRMLNSMGHLWLAGVKVDWSGFYHHQRRCRLPLPSYPFERQRYWIEPANIRQSERAASGVLSRKPDIADWFYLPGWKQSLSLVGQERAELAGQKTCILVFIDECGLGTQLVKQLEHRGHEVIRVNIGSVFTQLRAGEYCLNPCHSDDYNALLSQLVAQQKLPQTIVHLWSVTPPRPTESPLATLEPAQDQGFYSLLFLAQALGRQKAEGKQQITVISNNMQPVTGDEVLCPEKATLLGAVKVIPQEYPNITCRSIDLVLPMSGNWQEGILDQLLSELTVSPSEQVIAYRGLYRWVQTFEPIRLGQTKECTSRLKTGGVYLITGGLGGIGLTLAEHLAKSAQPKLILTGRSAFPQPQEWSNWLDSHDPTNPISRKICKVQELERLGAEVWVASADVACLQQMTAVITQAETRFGAINGVIHAAGIADAGIIHGKSREMTEMILSPKVTGALVLDHLLKDAKLDFFVLCSSIGSIVYQSAFGQVGYCAANDFLDIFAYHKTFRDDTFTVSINWTGWQEVGMLVEATKQLVDRCEDFSKEQPSLINPISPSEGIEVFTRVLNSRCPRVAISTQDLICLIERYQSFNSIALLDATDEPNNGSKPKHSRPKLSSSYVAPRNETEQKLASIWQTVLGLEPVGIHDDFFELGGDSIFVAQVISQIRKLFQVDLPIKTIFETPTVDRLSETIKANWGTTQKQRTSTVIALGDREEGEL